MLVWLFNLISFFQLLLFFLSVDRVTVDIALLVARVNCIAPAHQSIYVCLRRFFVCGNLHFL